MRRHAGTGTRAARCCVRGSHVRIRAMINIEKCALCPFKKNFFVALKGTMQKHNRVADERAQFFASRPITFVDFAKTDRLCTERLEDSVVVEDLGLQLF